MRIIKCLTSAAAFILIMAAPVCAMAPYQNYTYDFEGMPNAESNAYVPEQVITGSSLNLSNFNSPSDIFVDQAGNLYISDTGNNRIIRTDKNYKVQKIIRQFTSNGKTDQLNRPTGIFVNAKGNLYIADTGNKRVVVLSKDGKLLMTIGNPKSSQVSMDFVYTPTKVAVDFADRVFVVSKNCTEGIMEFDQNGSFLGYYGAIKTQSSLVNAFWKAIATKKQKQSMALTIPTEYSSIDIDSKGFVYGTVSAIDTTNNFSGDLFIHKLNPMGADVLKRYGFYPPMGDVEYDYSGNIMKISKLCDILVLPDGIYSVLDSYRGRIFTYDSDGDLLYIFGSMGTSLGQFGNPVALAETADNHYLVLDNKYDQIVEFKPTDYSRLLLRAVIDDYQRNYTDSEKQWNELLRYTSKSELIFDKIGLSSINRKDYKSAMKYLKLADDRTNYSEAYKYYRAEMMNRYFGPLMTVLIILIVMFMVWRSIQKHRKPREETKR